MVGSFGAAGDASAMLLRVAAVRCVAAKIMSGVADEQCPLLVPLTSEGYTPLEPVVEPPTPHIRKQDRSPPKSDPDPNACSSWVKQCLSRHLVRDM